MIAGVVMKLWMFVLRLSHSGKAVHVAYANTAQESFLDGHLQAFARLGGVPTGMIRYDNLKPAVIRVLLGRDRWENDRFIALRSHFGFDSFYCRPGIEGAHEKGGVEGEIGRFRRRHLTPVPHVGSLAELNVAMAAADDRDDARRIAARAETVGAAAARELPLLGPLPAGAFDPALHLSARVDAKARICVRQSYYSVPAGLAGRRVEVALGASTITARSDGRVVAEHARSLHKGTEDLILDHYLEILARKPGALAGATALAAARASGAFTPVHQQFWDAARRASTPAGTDGGTNGGTNGGTAGRDSAGTRALVGVLLLHRTLPVPAIIAGMQAAIGMAQFDPDVVAVAARCHLEGTRPAAPTPLPPAAVTALDARPLPVLHAYDQLLTAGVGA
ncbi:hypothetical protein SAMN05661080_05133 [Modestobacter sp. DSM 44400]|uniref:Mu transposase domain-containing protein n=1 Tax=Modestobacter sp. DSM 44400 TaxID=1550230 RepID=UPI000898C800|nr:IS21 family transposase [Modestobacter sp. DSM 44400]SDY95779.1 hypothetical protein SAMN05661080_05133 [Modestobacter sp. DSM 44400]